MSSLNYVQDVTLAKDLIVNLAETITLFEHSLKAIIDFEMHQKMTSEFLVLLSDLHTFCVLWNQFIFL